MVAELASVPTEKRLVGWIVVVCATLAGLTVLLGLYSYTVYVSFPTQRHAAVIDYLNTNTVRSLDEGTQARRREVETVFLALANANEEGNITAKQLFAVVLAFLDAAGDGSIEDAELDALVATIHDVIDQSVGERL